MWMNKPMWGDVGSNNLESCKPMCSKAKLQILYDGMRFLFGTYSVQKWYEKQKTRLVYSVWFMSVQSILIKLIKF